MDVYENKYGKIYSGDCLEVLDNLIEKNVKVDCCITDLPYGTTKCKWDQIIPFDEMWDRLNKLVKPNGAICLFGTEPFSSLLRCSNLKDYRYDIIWEKERVTNFFFVKKQIAKCHENISVFYKKQPTYNVQYQAREGKKAWSRSGGIMVNKLYDQVVDEIDRSSNGNLRYPRSIQKFSIHNNGLLHPTQKPTELLEFLIKSFTNEEELVLDFTAGSCSLAEACINSNRRFICIEKDKNYYNVGVERIKNI